MNSIAVLVFPIHYVAKVLQVLQGLPLTTSDKYSFDLATLNTENDKKKLVKAVLLDDEKLFEDFTDVKYGNYYRNLHGIIQHTHYHLGQISLIKKILIGAKAHNSIL